VKTRGGTVLSDSQTAERDSRIYYYWLLLAIFVEYARPASFFSFLRIPLIYTLIPIGLLAASFFAKGLRPMSEIFSDPLSKWVAAYVVLISFSFVYAIVGEFAFNVFKFGFGFGVLFLLVARICTTEGRLYGVVFTLLLAHLFLLLMNPQVLTQPETRNYILGATFLGDGNDFALSLCLLLPCVLDIAMRATKLWHKVLTWMGLLLMLFAVIASQSRGASLGVGAVLIYLWLNSPRKVLSLFGIAAAACVALLYAPANYFDRMKTISDYENEGSAAGRILIWKAGTRMALDNPVLGVGAGNFPVAYGTKYKPSDTYGWKNAHSAYFQVWGELGTVGFVVFAGVILTNFSRNARLRKAILARTVPGDRPPAHTLHARRLYMINAAILGFVVAGAFLSCAYYPHVFILAGLGLAARSLASRDTGIALLVPEKHNARRRAKAARQALTSSKARDT
jgi:putative inorganic carbon (hco3(-)) transporter